MPHDGLSGELLAMELPQLCLSVTVESLLMGRCFAECVLISLPTDGVVPSLLPQQRAVFDPTSKSVLRKSASETSTSRAGSQKDNFSQVHSERMQNNGEHGPAPDYIPHYRVSGNWGLNQLLHGGESSASQIDALTHKARTSGGQWIAVLAGP
jgi:hypothetical protein